MVKFLVKNLGWIVVVVLVFTALTPLIFVQKWTDTSFLQTGPIGDTIGGITAPFINGLAALLVYIAFKEQLNANEILKHQQRASHLEAQIDRLEIDAFRISKVATAIVAGVELSRNNPENFDNNHWVKHSIDRHLINKAIYITSVFEHCLAQCSLAGESEEYIRRRLGILYRIIYQDYFREIWLEINQLRNTRDTVLLDLLLEIQRLEKQLGNLPNIED